MATISNTDQHDITVYQGKTYIEVFTVQVLTNPNLDYNASTNPYIALDLTQYNVRAQVRKTYDGAAVASFYSTGTSPRFVKDNVNGIITMTLIPTDTSALVFTDAEADWYYDIELEHTITGVVLLLSYGSFIIKREITRVSNV